MIQKDKFPYKDESIYPTASPAAEFLGTCKNSIYRLSISRGKASAPKPNKKSNRHSNVLNDHEIIIMSILFPKRGALMCWGHAKAAPWPILRFLRASVTHPHDQAEGLRSDS
jgi:hypothetical protein